VTDFNRLILALDSSKTRRAVARLRIPLALGCAVIGLSSCAPTVNLATPQPMKFDVGMRLDIYQKTPPKPKDEESALQIAQNRRLRSGEIQQLKNDRVIGETRDGYLDLRRTPPDAAYLAYAKGVLNAENADRTVLYLANAQQQSRPLEMVESDYAKLWYDRAFPGEWVQKEDGTWIQK
jgi:uncharacterized protein YdbL (DUF1318 family)